MLPPSSNQLILTSESLATTSALRVRRAVLVAICGRLVVATGVKTHRPENSSRRGVMTPANWLCSTTGRSRPSWRSMSVTSTAICLA